MNGVHLQGRPGVCRAAAVRCLPRVYLLLGGLLLSLCGGCDDLAQKELEHQHFETASAMTDGWDIRSAPHAVEAWNRFLRDYPDGEFAERATQLREEAQAVSAVASAGEQVLQDPDPFVEEAADVLRRYPESRYAPALRWIVSSYPHIVSLRSRYLERLRNNPDGLCLVVASAILKQDPTDPFQLRAQLAEDRRLLWTPDSMWGVPESVRDFALRTGCVPLTDGLAEGISGVFTFEGRVTARETLSRTAYEGFYYYERQRVTIEVTIREDGEIVWSGTFSGEDPPGQEWEEFQGYSITKTGGQAERRAWEHAADEFARFLGRTPLSFPMMSQTRPAWLVHTISSLILNRGQSDPDSRWMTPSSTLDEFEDFPPEWFVQAADLIAELRVYLSSLEPLPE